MLCMHMMHYGFISKYIKLLVKHIVVISNADTCREIHARVGYIDTTILI